MKPTLRIVSEPARIAANEPMTPFDLPDPPPPAAQPLPEEPVITEVRSPADDHGDDEFRAARAA